MSVYYIYDGTFDGLLCAYYQALNLEINPFFCNEYFREFDLFAKRVDVKKTEIASKKMINKLSCVYDHRDFYVMTLVFLSEIDGFEQIIFDYLVAVLLGGINKSDMSNDMVNKYLKLFNRVSFEVHRLKGLIRFRELRDNILYAPFEPDFNVINLLANYFKKRISDSWIMHDKKRNIALLWNGCDIKEFEICEAVDNLSEIYSEREDDFQNMWRIFYKSIAIKERYNLKAKKNFMPVRYWKYLIENP